jgi:hypothetical protein
VPGLYVPYSMTSSQAQRYMKRIEAQLADGTLTLEGALLRAYALGAETERMDAMHHACGEYSKARTERELAFGSDTVPPSSR